MSLARLAKGAGLTRKVLLTDKDHLGLMLLGVRVASTSPEERPHADDAFDYALEGGGMVDHKKAWNELYRQGGMLGEEVRSSSMKFVRDSLPAGQKAPEEGSRVEYSRPDDALIFARHLAELKEKSKGGEVNPQRASSVLTRDEARQYLRKGTLPQRLRAF